MIGNENVNINRDMRQKLMLNKIIELWTLQNVICIRNTTKTNVDENT